VSDPEKLVHKRKERKIGPIFCLDRYLSLPKDGLTSIEYLEFDVKFEQTLFITKSESCLNEVIFDEKKIPRFDFSCIYEAYSDSYSEPTTTSTPHSSHSSYIFSSCTSCSAT
jgi:hypothetical protein